jgi:hypothetical protein
VFEIQPQFHPALLRLSAMISYCFAARAAFTDYSKLFAVLSWSIQAVRSLFGFALPAHSPLR